MAKRWTEADDQYIRAHAHLGAEHIAPVVGHTVVAVNNRASAFGIPLGRNDPQRLVSAGAFMSRVEFDTNGGCWLWSGQRDTGRGYGYVGKKKLAHRHSWEMHIGPIPDGLCILHRCDTPSCVNPAHLFLGTTADNNADMVKKRRHAFGERQPRAKITDTQAREILTLLHQRMGPTEIARRVGCSYQTVTNIQCKGAWSHVGTAPKPKRRLQSRGFERAR